MPAHAHSGHRQRLKMRYQLDGLDHFSDHEVLELLLTFAIPQKDVNPLGHALIDHFGSISAVFEATHEELGEVPGIGDHTATLIRLVSDIRRYLSISGKKAPVILKSSIAAGTLFMDYLRNEPYECFAMATVRSDMSLIRLQKLSRGSLTATSVFLRTAAELAFRQRAFGVLFAHNHPSGECVPSEADLTITQKLHEGLGLLDIRLLDHVITTKDQYFSIVSNCLVDIKKAVEQQTMVADCVPFALNSLQDKNSKKI